MVELVSKILRPESVEQYKLEERSIMARRFLSYENRINALVDCMCKDTISTKEHVELLRSEIYEYTKDLNFKKSKNMGDILSSALDFVRRNYESVHTQYL